MSMKNRLTTGLMATLVGMAFAWQAQAAGIRTWDGGGANNNWNTPANWDGDATAPGAGDTLAFGGSARLTNTNNLTAETSFAGLTFNSGAGTFVITGAVITLGGNVTNLAANLQTINLPMILDATRTFSTPSSGVVTVNGVISGSGGLVKEGAQSLNLSAANTYTGGVVIKQGSLRVPSLKNGSVASPLGAASADPANILIDGGTLEWVGNYTGTSTSDSSDRGITIGTNGGTIYQNEGLNAGLTLTGPLAYSGYGPRIITLATINSNRGNSWNAAIRDNGGATSLVFTNRNGGSSLWSVTGPFTFSGGLTVGPGVLQISGNSLGFSGGINVLPAGTLRLTSSGTFSQDIVNHGIMGSLLGAVVATYSGQISGSGQMQVENGSATLVITGTNNTYTGSTVLKTGHAGLTLTVSKLADGGVTSSIGASDNAASNLFVGSAATAATLKYVGPGDNTDRLFTLAATAAGAGFNLDASGSGPLCFTNRGAIAWGGTANQTRTLTLTGSNTDTNTLALGLSNNGSGLTSLTKAGAGTWVVSGTNTYSGATTINSGTLRLAGSLALGSGPLQIDPNNNVAGVLESDVDIVRPGGTAVGQMRINGGGTGAVPGFSAKGGDINVAFGSLLSPESLTWNVAPFYPNSSTFLLNGSMADSKLSFLNPINLNNGITPNRTIQVSANTAEMSGALTASSPTNANLTKTGAGTLILSGNNVLSNITVNAGALTLSGTTAFTNLVVNAGSASLSGTNTFVGATLNAGSLSLTGSNTYKTMTINGGSLTLGGSKLPSGATTFSGGTLVLDYTVENNDKLNPASALTFGSTYKSAALVVLGHPSTPFTQVVNGLTLAGYAHSIDLSGTTILSVGSLNRAVGMGLLMITNAGSGVLATTAGTASSLLTNANSVSYATYNGDWAAKDAANANVVAGSSISGFYTSDTWAPGNNTDVTGSGSPASGSTTASLRFNAPGASTLTLSGANTISRGGILVTPNVGANLTKITGGSISQPSARFFNELVIVQNNTNGALQIDSEIKNTLANLTLTKAGPGKLILTSTKTADGPINLFDGILQFGDGTTTGAINMPGGINTYPGAVLLIAAGAGGLTVTNSGAIVPYGTVTVDVPTNCILINGGFNSTGGGTWIKTGTGILRQTGTGFTAGWVKEGTFLSDAGANYTINGGATIGATNAGAPEARVVLLGTRDPIAGGSVTIYRTGILDLNGHEQALDTVVYGGGGLVTNSGVYAKGKSINITYNAIDQGGQTAFYTVPMEGKSTRNDSQALIFTVADDRVLDVEVVMAASITNTPGTTGWAMQKNGTGTVLLGGTNSWPGNNNVYAGVLMARSPASLPGYNGNNRWPVSAGATLAVRAGGTEEWTAADIDALRGTTPSHFASGAWFGIDTTGGDFTYDSVIGNGVGTLGFRKLGTNRLVLSAANTFSGNTLIQAGTLVASNANALGTSGTITVNSNAAFAVGSGITFSRPVTFNPGSILSGQGTFNANGSWNCPAGLILAPGLPTGTLTVDVGGQTLALADNTLRIAFPAEATSKLLVNGTLNIGSTAKLVLSGKPPFKKTVLAEGTARVGQFQEANVDLSGLERAGVIQYTATQVVLNVPSPGTLLIIR